MIPHDSELLKHEKLLQMILMKYYTVSDMMVIYKYTYWLIHESAFTQYTHKYVIKNLKFLLLVYMYYRYKTMWHEKTCNIKLISFKNTDTWCYVLYDTQMNWIITKQSSQKWFLCRCEYISMHRHWIMSSVLFTTMWLCTYQHCHERGKR